MQYTTHYNLNLPEGTDIVNPLIQDNPNYSAIDTALYNNKLRVIGNATHTKTGTNHNIVLADSDINAFKFVATGDYATGDTFTVDGVTVTARVADGSTIPNGAFKINSTIEAIIDGTILNLVNVSGTVSAGSVIRPNNESVETAISRIDTDLGTLAPVNGFYTAFPQYLGGGQWSIVVPVDTYIKNNYNVSVASAEVVNIMPLTIGAVSGRNNSIKILVSEDLTTYTTREIVAKLNFTHI